MEFVSGFENIKDNTPTAITIGKFDALHRGHRLLVDSIVARKALGEKSVVICFSTSPRIALGDNENLQFIITKGERKRILESLGVDCLFELTFDESMIKMEPEDFTRLLVERLNMKYLCVGTDFRFGYKGRGDVNLLKNLSKELGFILDAKEKVEYKSDYISSTRIRNAILHGDMTEVNEMLGHIYSFEGKVVGGNHIGKGLGFPTANIVPKSVKVLPPFGVYETELFVDGVGLKAITNIGIRPTIDEKEKSPVIETFIFNYDNKIYDKDIRVAFKRFIRPERKFDSKDLLIEQINSDIESVIGE